MKAEGHVVQDLRFEVEFESQDQAFEEQERLSTFAQGPALRIVEEAFDEALAPGEVLRLELLDIDLGVVDAADMEAQWSDRLRSRLQEVLAAHRARRVPALAATDAAAAASARLAEQADDAPAASWHTPHQADLEALLHFLQHGRQAWHRTQHSDPVALADRVWQHSAPALVSRLRALLAPGVARPGSPEGSSDSGFYGVAQRVLQRLLRQLPGPWLQALDSALRGAAAPQPPWPDTLALAQQRLLSAASTRPPQTDAESRAALRRLKALLLDDSPTLSAADRMDLRALWQRLQQTDAAGLRQLLLDLGALARVRRRMARLWPEALLRQVPALWLGSAAAEAVAAVVKGASAPTRRGMRRRRWEAALRHLLLAGGLDRFDREALADAIDAQDAQRGLSRQSLQPTLAPPQQPTGDHTRAAWRLQAATWARQRVLAAVVTRAELARCLSAWLPAPDAAALAALAFDTLPRAWLAAQPAGALPLDAARRCQWCLQHLATAPECSVTAPALVALWWRAIAVQLQRSPSALLAALQDSTAPADRSDKADSACRVAWLRWLPKGALPIDLQGRVPPATSAASSAPAPGSATATSSARDLAPDLAPDSAPDSAPDLAAARLRLVTALSGNAWGNAAQDWQRLQDADPDALRAVVRDSAGRAAARRHIATHLSPLMWLALLRLFLPEPTAVWLAAGLLQLARLRATAAEAAGLRLDAAPDPAVTIELRAQALAALVWQAGDTGSDFGGAVLSQLVQHRARALALPPRVVAGVAGVARVTAADAAQPPRSEPSPESAATRLAAALQPGGTADLAQAWQAMFAAGPGPALRTLRHLAEQNQLRHGLVQHADGSMWRQLLALCLPRGQDLQVEQAQHSLALEMSDILGRDNAMLFLREHALAALLWQPVPDATSVNGHLLEQAAWRLSLPLPALALRLEAGPSAAGLFAPWVAERSPRDIGVLARSADRAERWPRNKVAPSAAWIGAVVSHLRSPATSGPTEAAESARAALLGLCGPGLTADRDAEGEVEHHARHHVARHALARELESPPSAQRLAHWLHPGELQCVVAWLRPADAAALGRLWPALQALANESDVSAAAVTAPSATPAATPSATLAHPAWPLVARQLLRECFEEDRPLDPAGLLQRTQQALRRAAVLRQPVPVSLAPSPATSPAATFATPSTTPFATPFATAGHTPATISPLPPDALDAIPNEALFINNAGIVIAAPYLPRLFSMLGLAGEKAFVDAAAAERGVLLMQYAVTGERQAPEPLLLLNKILCGLPLEWPVGRDFEPSPAERDAVDGLLRAIIGHWTALGQTSVAGLRQTFLQREGRLEHSDDTWQLQVQPQTFDVLMDRLPWGFSIIKYPWMREVLHVQW